MTAQQFPPRGSGTLRAPLGLSEQFGVVSGEAASRVVGALGVKGADQCLDPRSHHQQISSRLSGSGVPEGVRDALRREDGVSDGRLEGLVSESGDPDGLVLLLPKAELHSSDVVFSPMATCSEEIVQLITACRPTQLTSQGASWPGPRADACARSSSLLKGPAFGATARLTSGMG